MTSGLFARTADEVAAFLLAATCAGCDRPGTLLCASCRDALAPRPVRRESPSGLPLVAALPFEGVPARVIRRLKEEGETSLARPLGVALRSVLRDVGADAALVPIPTSRAAFRRRGYRVPELLLRRAGYRPRRLLLPARAAGDQRELGRVERARNVRGSMRVAAATRPTRVVIVDDVTTSGATFDEAARVLAASGIHVVAGVAAASTPMRS
ncbi:ComF family protein [Microbacterium sp. NIBRBAC000506063]|uniref:ComF family protein n=1 Tax=Microbacterium sp. NIBRBAC000506063 TaxID=2734618 RepID=UPI001BB5B253|nr:ComF family protein [Microbacterium sp. NIBRBAC000506063]QTV79418.1 ComF family protein [Microbacterium sp. NIBRBAC000506063]